MAGSALSLLLIAKMANTGTVRSAHLATTIVSSAQAPIIAQSVSQPLSWSEDFAFALLSTFRTLKPTLARSSIIRDVGTRVTTIKMISGAKVATLAAKFARPTLENVFIAAMNPTNLME